MPDRREFLSTVSAAALAPVQSNPPSKDAVDGLIPRESEPPNFETPLVRLADELTSTSAFYIRNHFSTPKIDVASWRLEIEGAVKKPASLSIDDIRQLPASTRNLTMECAGNGRVFLVPKVRGVNWALGAVGNAQWKGIPLKALLDRAGVNDSAIEVILEGADVGTVNDDPKSPGPVAFARSLPIAKARQSEVLLAYEMNGQPLTRDHGWPLRAIVGGWYGMASVKWLTRIIVSESPFKGFWQTMDYSQFERVNGLPTMTPITAMRVKAMILRPHQRQVLHHNSYDLFGVAWAGELAVAKVEVSVDGGKNWDRAQLQSAGKPFEWVHWTYRWNRISKGTHTLMARATDSAGTAQPMQRDPDRRTYQVNHVIPVEVTAS